MKGKWVWLPTEESPSLARAHEEPEEECSRQREQQGWKSPGVFTLRIKARDLPTTHGTLSLPSPHLLLLSSLTPQHPYGPPYCSQNTPVSGLLHLLFPKMLKRHLPVKPFLMPIYNFKAPLPSLFFSQCNHFPTHNSLILFLICLTYVSSRDSTLVTAAPQGPAHA